MTAFWNFIMLALALRLPAITAQMTRQYPVGELTQIRQINPWQESTKIMNEKMRNYHTRYAYDPAQPTLRAPGNIFPNEVLHRLQQTYNEMMKDLLETQPKFAQFVTINEQGQGQEKGQGQGQRQGKRQRVSYRRYPLQTTTEQPNKQQTKLRKRIHIAERVKNTTQFEPSSQIVGSPLRVPHSSQQSSLETARIPKEQKLRLLLAAISKARGKSGPSIPLYEPEVAEPQMQAVTSITNDDDDDDDDDDEADFDKEKYLKISCISCPSCKQ